MELTNDLSRMLQFIERPAFIVKNQTIVLRNQAAAQWHISPDSRLSMLLRDGLADYESFTDGTLVLNVYTTDQVFQASVEKLNECDLFILDLPENYPELRAFSLASLWLRTPLTGLLNSIDPNNQTAKRMTRQIHRAVNNMSDAVRYLGNRKKYMTTQEINAFVSGVVENAGAKTEQTGVKIRFIGLPNLLHMLIDEELLERAIFNIISNSIKAGATEIQVRLTQQMKTVSLTVQDNGKGVDANKQAQMFHRYLRMPSLNEGTDGIGLGMVIIRAAAHAHQGTILMEHKPDTGLKLTMTLSITHSNGALRSPVMRFDYNGYEDHALTELSDVLPDSQY